MLGGDKERRSLRRHANSSHAAWDVPQLDVVTRMY